MSKLFNVEVNTINYHLKEIFKTNELNEESVIRKIRITASDGKKYNTNFYNLDAIIAVGYRVNSKEATDFRIWATKTLKDNGKISKRLADEKAEREYDKCNKTQKIVSDFDKLLIETRKIQKEEKNG